MIRYIYDIETYPNAFTIVIEHAYLSITWTFEISGRKNESRELIEFLMDLRTEDAEMVGFNNIGYDYSVLHTLILMGESDAYSLYEKSKAIIDAPDYDKFSHLVYPSDRFVNQIDLYKIHHFDNKARATSLKALEFNMRMDNLSDLPFKPGTEIPVDKIDTVLEYNAHDVKATKKFYFETLDQIKFREEMVKKYPNKDWINFNDTKIGKEYFIQRLEDSGIPCFEIKNGSRSPRQTVRRELVLKDAILPWIEFEQPEFHRVLNWLKQQRIQETKGVFKDLSATVNGFTFDFGTGGIHGSVDNRIIESDETGQIIDLDVSSYYPNLAISNGFYPEHLGEEFCIIYKDLYDQRKSYAKGTTENAMLKLALNGTYGDSNNKFSPFYDPLFTMKITLNGQLLLCMLAEQLMKIEGLQLIQINTDGLTVKVPQNLRHEVEKVKEKWETATNLELEAAYYSKMCIRDVNSYIAVYEDGKVKRKGAYEHKLEWHKNASALVVPKVAEQHLVYGKPIRETILSWGDHWDFLLRVKVPRTGYLEIDNQQVQNISRYYISTDGGELIKWLPPLKNKTEWRSFNVEKGWKVQVCNNMKDFDGSKIDYEYYIQEVEKLVLGLS